MGADDAEDVDVVGAATHAVMSSGDVTATVWAREGKYPGVSKVCKLSDYGPIVNVERGAMAAAVAQLSAVVAPDDVRAELTLGKSGVSVASIDERAVLDVPADADTDDLGHVSLNRKLLAALLAGFDDDRIALHFVADAKKRAERAIRVAPWDPDGLVDPGDEAAWGLIMPLRPA